jgi:hypothetical protein
LPNSPCMTSRSPTPPLLLTAPPSTNEPRAASARPWAVTASGAGPISSPAAPTSLLSRPGLAGHPTARSGAGPPKQELPVT